MREEKMNLQKGRMTMTSFLITLILVYGGFVGYKFLSGYFAKKELSKEVHDTLGRVRGGGFTSERAEEIVTGILKKRGITPLEVIVKLGEGKLVYHYKFEQTTDYLLFQKKEVVDVTEEMEAYGEI
jgi:hypothetical protein